MPQVSEASDDDDEDGEHFVDQGTYDDEPDVIPCPYCREEISELAQVCPKCKNYLSREDAPTPGKPIWWVVIVVVLILAFALIGFMR